MKRVGLRLPSKARLFNELKETRELVAALRVRARANDAALEYAVTKNADANKNLTAIQRNFELLEMRWHDDHDHAVEFADDILSTAGESLDASNGGGWLVLRTHAQHEAAAFLIKRGHAEQHPFHTHLARFKENQERQRQDRDIARAGLT